MEAIATITVPFFAIIFFGYLAARLRWVPQEAVPAFNGFLLYFAVPALLFRLVSEMTVADFAQSGYLIAYSVTGIVTLLVIVVGALSHFQGTASGRGVLWPRRQRDQRRLSWHSACRRASWRAGGGPCDYVDRCRSDGDRCGRTRLGTIRDFGRTRLDQRYGRGRTARTHQSVSHQHCGRRSSFSTWLEIAHPGGRRLYACSATRPARVHSSPSAFHSSGSMRRSARRSSCCRSQASCCFTH